MTFGVASSMRVASSLAAKPPNTTECTAPMRAQAEHGDQRLRHHRHVDDDAVALADAGLDERAGELRDLVAQGAIGIGSDRVGDRAVVDQRGLLAAALLDVAVERVPAGVEHAALEPAVERRVGVVEHPVPLHGPVDVGGRGAPRSRRDRRANAHAPRPSSAASRRRARPAGACRSGRAPASPSCPAPPRGGTDNCGDGAFRRGRRPASARVASMPTSSLSPWARPAQRPSSAPSSSPSRASLPSSSPPACALSASPSSPPSNPRSTPLTVRPELCGKRRALQSITRSVGATHRVPRPIGATSDASTGLRPSVCMRYPQHDR